MKITILLLHCFITQSMPSKLCFQHPCSEDDEEFDNYKYEEALEYCAEVGPMKMPFYGTYMYIVDAYFVILNIASVTFGT